MDARELRIGNLVLNENGEAIYVSRYSIRDSEKFSPIPLTEGWLAKFYFYKYRNPNNTDSYLFHFRGFVLIKDKHIRLRNGVSKKIKYVHQLQNLYFALEMEELGIKP